MRIYQTLRKRGLALFLALIMCLSLVQVPAFAAEDDASEPADALVMDVTGPGVQEPEAVPEEESPAPESEEIAAPDTQEEPEADEPEEYAPEYAAVEELEAAFEAAVEALEDGGVEGGIAALEEYLNIFDRLSPEDQEANQEAREAAVDYLQTLLNSLEGIEDRDVEALGQTITEKIIVVEVSGSNVMGRLNGSKYSPVSSLQTRSSSSGSNSVEPFSWSYTNSTRATFTASAYSSASSSIKWGIYLPAPDELYENLEYTDYKWGSSYVSSWYSISNIPTSPYSPTSAPTGNTIYLYIQNPSVPHTHSYSWVQTTAPTCYTNGTETFTCSCGATNGTNSIPASIEYHTWGNWYENNSGKEQRDCNYNVHHEYRDIQVQNVTLNYRDRGMTFGDTETYTKGTDVTVKVCTNTRNGYTFIGWDTDSSADEVVYAAGSTFTINTNTTLYAVWEKNPVPEAKTISVTPLVTFEVEGKDAAQLAADQIPENYQMTLTYADLDGKHERTLSKADATVTTEGNLGLPVLTWPAFDVKIAKESGAKIDIAVQQDNYHIGDNSEIIYNRTYTTDGGSQSDGAGMITVRQAAYSVKATTKNYYKLPDPGTPNLTITKSADKDIVKVGETVKYTITVENTGKAAATNVVVSDTLPEGLEWVQDNDASFKGGVLTWNIPQIEAGGSKSVSFTAKVTQSGTISNTASVTSDEIKTPVDSDPEDITGVKVSIKTTKSHSKITVAEKTGIATIPYTVTVKNTGDDLFGLAIIDKLTVKVTDQNGNPSTEPVKVTYKDLKVDGQTVSAEMSETGGIVNAIARDGKFAAEQTVTLTYNIEVQNKGQTAVVATLSNTATGGSWSTNPSGGRMFRMARDGGYDVTDSASDTASVGDSASVVIPPPQAETVTITVKFVDENDNEVGKTETTVEKNGSYDVTEETRKVPDGYEANGNPTGDVKGTADTDKVVTVPVKKTPAPPAPTPADWGRLTLTKTANKTQARAGEDITYTIRVTNNTGKDLTGITVSEPLDSNVTFKSAAPAGYNAASGVWTIASLANGASATLTLTVTVKDGVTNATIRNTAAITDASTTGPDPEKLPDGTRPGDTADVTVPEADARRVTVTWLNWNGDRLDRADWNTDEREPS